MNKELSRPSEPDFLQIMTEIRDDLQKTASEQDILDGGSGKRIYTFTYADTFYTGWGTDGAKNSKEIRHLFNKK